MSESTANLKWQTDPTRASVTTSRVPVLRIPGTTRPSTATALICCTDKSDFSPKSPLAAADTERLASRAHIEERWIMSERNELKPAVPTALRTEAERRAEELDSRLVGHDGLGVYPQLESIEDRAKELRKRDPLLGKTRARKIALYEMTGRVGYLEYRQRAIARRALGRQLAETAKVGTLQKLRSAFADDLVLAMDLACDVDLPTFANVLLALGKPLAHSIDSPRLEDVRLDPNVTEQLRASPPDKQTLTLLLMAVCLRRSPRDLTPIVELLLQMGADAQFAHGFLLGRIDELKSDSPGRAVLEELAGRMAWHWGDDEIDSD